MTRATRSNRQNHTNPNFPLGGTHTYLISQSLATCSLQILLSFFLGAPAASKHALEEALGCGRVSDAVYLPLRLAGAPLILGHAAHGGWNVRTAASPRLLG